MNFDQLKAFLCIARLGGIRRAANELNLTPPAVTSRLQSLEDDLGVTLMTRTKNGICLTKEGLLLKGHAEKIEHDLVKIRTDLTPSNEIRGIIRIGVTETIACSWLPDFITTLRKDYPKLIIELSVDNSIRLNEDLINKNMDLVIVMGAVNNGYTTNIKIPKFPQGWFCKPGYKVKDVTKVPIMIFSRSSIPYQELEHELMIRYGESGLLFPSTSISTNIEMVSSGIGVGIFPICLAKPLLVSGKLKQFDPGWSLQPLQFTISYLTFPKNEVISRIGDLALKVANDYS